MCSAESPEYPAHEDMCVGSAYFSIFPFVGVRDPSLGGGTGPIGGGSRDSLVGGRGGGVASRSPLPALVCRLFRYRAQSASKSVNLVN